MRNFVGLLVSLVLALALVGAMFALEPELKIEEDRDSLAHAAKELSDYPFTPLVSDLRVFSASWDKWVDEIDVAAKKKKSGESSVNPEKLVENNTPIFRKGAGKIHTRVVMMAIATVLGPIVFFLGVLFGVKLFPKVEHLRRLSGRVALMSLAICAAGLALPCVVAEDFTGLAFAVPTLIGAIVGWVARTRAPAAAR